MSNLELKKLKRVVWAIDPFDRDQALDGTTLSELHESFRRNEVYVEPVYVFTPIGEIERMATERIVSDIAQRLAQLGFYAALPKVIERPLTSTKGQAETLMEYVQSSGAGLIVLSTHGRKGISRFLYGSFAERVLALSPVPVLFLNRNSRPKDAGLERVLFATDFTPASRVTFQTFLAQISGISGEINLFHDISLPLEMTTYFAQWDVGVPAIDDLVERQQQWAREQSSEWVKLASAAGFKINANVVVGRTRVANEIMLAAVERKCGLIAMHSSYTGLGSIVFGSQSREVFRAGELPVWVYGPHFSQAAKVGANNDRGPARSS